MKILTYDFVKDAPLDVMTWCKFEGNNNHDGASLSPIEMYDEVSPALAEWESHCNDKPEGHKIQAQTCPTRLQLYQNIVFPTQAHGKPKCKSIDLPSDVLVSRGLRMK